jgi:hypothetical protein
VLDRRFFCTGVIIVLGLNATGSIAMIEFRKPSGMIVEVNDDSVEAAESLGWERVINYSHPAPPPPEAVDETPKRRGRPPKA